MKLYESKNWLKLKFYDQKKTIDEIAKEAEVNPMTIRRALKKYGLIK